MLLTGVKISEPISQDIGFLVMPLIFLDALGVSKSHIVAHWMLDLPNQWRFGFENCQNDSQIVKIAMFQVKTRLIGNDCPQTGNGVEIR